MPPTRWAASPPSPSSSESWLSAAPNNLPPRRPPLLARTGSYRADSPGSRSLFREVTLDATCDYRPPLSRHRESDVRDVLRHNLASGQGFEPRTLRLTDRCGPFRNDDLNTLRAAKYHHLPGLITGVAVRTRDLRQPVRRGATPVRAAARRQVSRRKERPLNARSGWACLTPRSIHRCQHRCDRVL